MSSEPLLLELDQGERRLPSHRGTAGGEGSSLTLLERQSGEGQAFFSTLCNLNLEAEAQLTHQRLGLIGGEGRWLSQHAVTLGSQAHYALLLAQGGANFRRNELSIDLRGHGATVAVAGASLTDGAQHLDTQLAMNHCEPNGTSTQRFRALAAGQSKTTLNGRIHILPQAQKSDAAFNARSLLLSRGAELNAKPELEIYADDVACAHGATVGELDGCDVHFLPAQPRPDRASGSGGPGLCAPCDGCRRVEDEALAAYLSSAFKTAFDRAFAQAGDAGATNAWGLLMLRPETARPFDIEALRAEFPALSQEVNGKPLVYMDSAASTLKPQAVIDAISHYYAHDHSNVHRGAPMRWRIEPAAFEAARDSVAAFPKRPRRPRSSGRGHLDPGHHGGDQPGGPKLGQRESLPWR